MVAGLSPPETAIYFCSQYPYKFLDTVMRRKGYFYDQNYLPSCIEPCYTHRQSVAESAVGSLAIPCQLTRAVRIEHLRRLWGAI